MLVQAAVPMQLRIDDSRPPIHISAIHKNNARNAACYVREQVYQRTGLKCGMALAQLFEPNVVYPAWFFCSSLPACRQRIVCFSRQSGYFLDIFQKHTCSAGEESFMDVLLHLLIWSTLAFLCEPCRINGTQIHRDAQGKGTVGGYWPMLCSQLSAGISSSAGGGVGTQMDGRLLLITSPCRSSG